MSTSVPVPTSAPVLADFNFSCLDNDGLCVISCTGELDMASAGPLLDAITDGLGTGDVVLDGSGITFVDCAGLTAVLSGYAMASALQRSFSLAAPSAAMLRLLDLTETLQRLEVQSSVAGASRAALGRYAPSETS